MLITVECTNLCLVTMNTQYTLIKQNNCSAATPSGVSNYFQLSVCTEQ